MSRERYFRNTVDLTSNEHIFVEAGSLWMLDDPETGTLVLVDDDQYATMTHTTSLFVEENID